MRKNQVAIAKKFQGGKGGQIEGREHWEVRLSRGKEVARSAQNGTGNHSTVFLTLGKFCPVPDRGQVPKRELSIEGKRRVSADGLWCQFNANRNPHLGCSEVGNLIQCKQLKCDGAGL